MSGGREHVAEVRLPLLLDEEDVTMAEKNGDATKE